MKVLLCSVFVMATFFTAQGQMILASAGPPMPQKEIASPLVVQSGQRIQYKISRPPGYRMRKAGMILSIAGSAMFVGGLIVFNSGDPNKITGSLIDGTPITDEDDHHELGAEMLVLGTGMMIPGVILWTKGARKYHQSVKNQASINIRPSGLSLSYRF